MPLNKIFYCIDLWGNVLINEYYCAMENATANRVNVVRNTLQELIVAYFLKLSVDQWKPIALPVRRVVLPYSTKVQGKANCNCSSPMQLTVKRKLLVNWLFETKPRKDLLLYFRVHPFHPLRITSFYVVLCLGETGFLLHEAHIFNGESSLSYTVLDRSVTEPALIKDSSHFLPTYLDRLDMIYVRSFFVKNVDMILEYVHKMFTSIV